MMCTAWNLELLCSDRHKCQSCTFSSTLWSEQLPLHGETSSSTRPLSCSLQLLLVSVISSWELRQRCPIGRLSVRPVGRRTVKMTSGGKTTDREIHGFLSLPPSALNRSSDGARNKQCVNILTRASVTCDVQAFM